MKRKPEGKRRRRARSASNSRKGPVSEGAPGSQRAPASERSRQAQPTEKPPSSRRALRRQTVYGPANSEAMPRFAGIPSFLRLPTSPEPEAIPAVDVLICGAPFDGGSSFRSGARFGPRAVRAASALARRYSAALGVDIYDELRVADGGDIAVPPHDGDRALDTIAARADAIVRTGAIAGFVGGDQTVTLGALRGIHRAKLKAVSLIHIDAHSNASGPAWGREIHHGSVIRRAVEEGLVRADHTLQLGIRGPYSTGSDLAFALSHGFEIVNVDEVRWDLHSAISQIRKAARRSMLYVSVDLSVLDPAFAPGVGVPSPGGISCWELQQILRALVGADIIGFDVVEICPPYDHADLTAQVAVTTVQEILASIADSRRSVRSAGPPDSRRGRRLSP